MQRIAVDFNERLAEERTESWADFSRAERGWV